MTTCIYVDGVLASDSRVTSGTTINPVNFKKTFAVEGELFGEKLIGCCIAGNAFRKKMFLEWLTTGGDIKKYIPHFQHGLHALVLTDKQVWFYADGEFLEGWDGVAVGSGGAKASAYYNAAKQLGKKVTALDCITAATCPKSGDSASGGMHQWISRNSKGTTDMPATISPDDATKYEVPFS